MDTRLRKRKVKNHLADVGQNLKFLAGFGGSNGFCLLDGF